MGFKYNERDGLIAYIISQYKFLNSKIIYGILNDVNAYDRSSFDLIDLNNGLSRLQSDNLLEISNGKIIISKRLRLIIHGNTKFLDKQFDAPCRL